ncbi:MAG TPA: spermidine/putrescine ABC transporter permease PotB [Candidatus Competibacteraceae bacterium]|nr:MAG: spermidine/putrescine ABC transporter permease PotB [Candidatus Competibacteraceae bacterium]HNW77964.1 spermidine/putrescine ABC transporter permease PotB [Candidatus Competibacteraceae bacterium]HQC71370.1 spermidine/putrescine ABC transporter permease PotB [Candidatus Competibacteraceae bacterium]
MKTREPFKWVAVGTIWTWLALFALLPNAMVLVASVLERGQDQFFAFAFTLASYRRLLDPLYLSVLLDSLYLAALTTVLCLLIGYPFAYLLAQAPARRRALLLLLVIIPFWTSSLVRTYAMVILLKTNGLINQMLLGLGWISEPLELLYTTPAVIAGMCYALLPFMILPLYAALEKLDRRLIEAAHDLGAGRVTIFRRVIIPLTLPGIIAGAMLTFLPALGMFYVADLLGGAKTMLVGNLIRDQFLAARDWPFGSAASAMLTGLMALLMWAYYQSSRRANRGALP